ncbi:hypothetical protein Back11_40130 [Paenibacillus baekrokdamisoli]|uniref:DUF5668 domain-containing protein n=1 Tax=Paenibacillus baekrokdamisoli TaxID=1712516 RepID=A0A3G9JF67_9BACL|nr:hypothetical protein [Paenibacillus baekrokdamisoli]MBB3068290.1 hypothetical protein [Paenibacillus baekrokdamisoli]BBH22668.1 hypothetical protein Back11_40130 [Paenibacillus baekrokdamisoli]
MKRWRVGTLSMGLSLILIGVTILLSSWNHASAVDILLNWWPAVFILLGLEIIFFLAIKSKEQPIIHYDIFSILFVGVLCCLCIGFAAATASGLTHEIQYAIGSEDRTYDVPTIDQPVPASVTRIVVQTSGSIPKIDKITERKMHLFGTYRIRQYQDEKGALLQAADITTIHTIDHTMYISIKALPQRIGLNDSYPSTTLTMAVPKDLPLELRGANNEPIQ